MVFAGFGLLVATSASLISCMRAAPALSDPAWWGRIAGWT
jgi:hypothetical protein